MSNINQTLSEACAQVATYEQVAEDETELTKTTGLVLCFFALVSISFSVIIFAVCRNQFLRVQHRNFTMLLAFCIGAVTYTILVPFRDYYGQSEFLCDYYALCAFLSSYFLLMPQGCRVLSLYHRILLNKAVLELTFESVKTGEINAFREKSEQIRGPEMDVKNQNILIRDVNNLTLTLNMSLPRQQGKYEKFHEAYFSCFDKCFDACFNRFTKIMHRWAKSVYPAMLFITCWKHPKHLPQELRFRYFFASHTFCNFFCVFFFTLYMTAYIIYYSIVFAPFQGCTGCGVEKLYYLQLPLIGVFTLVVFSAFKWQWKYPDALGIKGELVNLGIWYGLIYFLVLPVLNGITDRPEGMGTWDWSFVTEVMIVSMVIYCMPFQVWKAYKESTVKIRRSSLTDILESDEGSKAFALHLATELSLENLYFYKAATAWKNHYTTHPEAINRLSKAREIVQLYIQQEAPFEINISHSMRAAILRTVESACEIEVFDEAVNEVFTLMAADPFFRFQRSKYYKAYENSFELKGTASDDLLYT